jgi:FAD/FMN-containing dehydrogenase
MSVSINDIHSGLNAALVARVSEVSSIEDVARELVRARGEGLSAIAAGGRHAMGGQQFAEGGVVLDTRVFNRVLSFDPERGLLQVEAGIQWPELVGFLTGEQDADDPNRWTIIQKQSGADRFSLGGTVSANGHGRGLTLAPIVADVESMTVVGPEGDHVPVSRGVNRELFSLAAGGYGLFGVIGTLTLRLTRAQVLERTVEIRSLNGVDEAFAQRIRDGYVFGDFQFSIDEHSDGFLTDGVFSCYRPVDPTTPIPVDQRTLSQEQWGRLLYLAHSDRAAAYAAYTKHYAATTGQLYRSDTLQMADYQDGYHRTIDAAIGAAHPSTEMISELYVPRDRLAGFMNEAAEVLRGTSVPVIYGTVRLIERDTDSFLAWAREPWACIIFNLCTEHTADGIARSADAFRSLIDLAIARGGSYFPTYHRWATLDQLISAHPRFPDFIAAKRERDPAGIFQSDWYRHYAGLLNGE